MAAAPMSSASRARPKSAALTVGQRLKERRQQIDMSLKDIELATRIRGKYLLAIEADDYQALPHDVYSKGFVQTYAQHVGLNGQVIAAQYVKERGEHPVQLRHQTSIVNTGPRLSSRGLAVVAVVLVLLAVVGYLLWQFSSLAAPPLLDVTNPAKDQVLYGSLITVNGHVSGGADVFVNDSPILSDANGNFTDAIALQDGVNAIRVSAKNRLGKSATVTRSILAHVPKTDPSSALPTATFDGVAVTVQVKDQTAAVTVMADDKAIFNGTMLPGTVQTFRAATKLTISTTNAGATILTITNSQTASHLLGAVGPMGQSKTGLEFAKDTQFQ